MENNGTPFSLFVYASALALLAFCLKKEKKKKEERKITEPFYDCGLEHPHWLDMRRLDHSPARA
jgi:hypothetical protein